MILLFQAVGQMRHSNDILANAVYLGYVSIPMVQSVTEYLSQLNPPPAQTGAWIGAMTQGLWQRGFFEESESMLYEVAELNDDDLRVAKEYLRVNATGDTEFMLDRLGLSDPSDDSTS